MYFPRPTDGYSLTSFDWTPIRYRNMISVLKNPSYAGVYVFGKTETRTEIVDGRARKTYHHDTPREDWDVFLQGHHEGYIEWEEYERNQALLASNAYGQNGGAKSGRGGCALLSGLLSCGRCGRRLCVAYTGKTPRPVYRCESRNVMLGLKRCFSVGGPRVDKAIAEELLRVVQPMAIEAAEQRNREMRDQRRRAAELDVETAQYEAMLAERRYAACDPDNRLIAATLEKHWEAALRRLEACKVHLDDESLPNATAERAA